MLNPLSINLFCSQDNTYKTMQLNRNNIQATNSLQDFSREYSVASKTYACTNPNFKAKQLNDIDLVLTDEPSLPRVSVQILKNDDFQAKPGLCTVYEIALHDQLHDLLRRNLEIKDNGSCIKDYKRKFDINCEEKDFVKTLDMINEQFVSPKIQKRYIDNALHLAPIGYTLHNLKIDTGFDYTDVPVNTTQEDYEKFMKLMDESGNSSWELLQNCYSLQNCHEQKISLMLALTQLFLNKIQGGICRVHGGGFAGVIATILPEAEMDNYVEYISRYVGRDNVYPMDIRAVGAAHIG